MRSRVRASSVERRDDPEQVRDHAELLLDGVEERLRAGRALGDGDGDGGGGGASASRLLRQLQSIFSTYEAVLTP